MLDNDRPPRNTNANAFLEKNTYDTGYTDKKSSFN